MQSKYYDSALNLLQNLIATQSFSTEEENTAALLENWFQTNGIEYNRHIHNFWVTNKHFKEGLPTILLNSHHDTVRPNKNYTRDPFAPTIEGDILYGLGSNDAGASLVSLMHTFLHFYEQENLKYNVVIACTAEEENFGANGIRSVLPLLPNIDCAIVGEPTGMNLAIAEKGLLVIDGEVEGVSGHAAHYNTVNPIYKAVKDIQAIENYVFEKENEVLGKVKATVTQVNAGKQHNVVPGTCSYVVDCRINGEYRNEEVFEALDNITEGTLKARSFRNQSSSIPKDHPLVQSGIALGRSTYGSPTISDQASLTCLSLKMGPGESTRSHQADEFIKLSELNEGIKLYIKLLENVL